MDINFDIHLSDQKLYRYIQIAELISIYHIKISRSGLRRNGIANLDDCG